MGNCSNEENQTLFEGKEKMAKNQIKINDFKKLYPISKCAFGTVWKVQSKKKEINIMNNNEGKNDKTNIFAMKEKCKANIYLKNSTKSVVNGREIMKNLNHKLICNMYYSFQDTENLYIVTDFFSGGDLRYLISSRNYFEENEVKFIIASIALTINYLHENNVIHRDIKPEKFIFGKNKYLHLTGCGVSFKCKKEETVVSATGTPGYMAPETIINQPHNFSVDYYALGVMLYELIMDERPYQGKNRQEIKEEMFKFEINLDNDDVPSGWDFNVKDLVNGLLKRKKKYRWGSNGFYEVQNHPWFKNIQWDKIENCEVSSPVVIREGENFDEEYAGQKIDDSIYEGNKQLYLNKVNESLVFKDFYFNYEDKTKNDENKVNNKKEK